ncbi:hypothetical protein ACIBEJ_00370 [Nonomuraea sp. NPDC050790]|uniref:hypothetical protein n=1 Tax=Nonomuraea sp. NPDC050790 TaxID=3364371 RepID=UPI0037927AD8
MGQLTVRANVPVLGFRDREERTVTDSPYIRKVIDQGKLTLLADHGSETSSASQADVVPDEERVDEAR